VFCHPQDICHVGSLNQSYTFVNKLKENEKEEGNRKKRKKISMIISLSSCTRFIYFLFFISTQNHTRRNCNYDLTSFFSHSLSLFEDAAYIPILFLSVKGVPYFPSAYEKKRSCHSIAHFYYFCFAASLSLSLSRYASSQGL
jgi:hypothetical protein